MTTRSPRSIYGASVRAAARRAKEARREADRLACEAWTKRMPGFRGPAQPSPTLGDALNAAYLYLEVRCLGCDTHHTRPLQLDVVALRYRYFGPRPLTEDGVFVSPATGLLNGRLGYRFDNGWRVQLDGFNLLNSKSDQITYA
jgi:hypothetical protein